MYRNTTEFCMCPIILLNSFVSSSRFFILVDFYGFLDIRSCHLGTDNFIFFFLIWMLCTYFSCLTLLASISSTMLSRSGQSGQPCLSLDLREKTFCFSLLSMMFTLDFLLCLGNFLPFLVCRVISRKGTEFC